MLKSEKHSQRSTYLGNKRHQGQANHGSRFKKKKNNNNNAGKERNVEEIKIWSGLVNFGQGSWAHYDIQADICLYINDWIQPYCSMRSKTQ